jgi:hypothetical protein
MIPGGREGPQLGKLYFEKKILFSRTSRPMSIKLGTYHPWVKGILNLFMGQVLFKGEIIIKMQKFGEVIGNFFPREPLSHYSSNLHESF